MAACHASAGLLFRCQQTVFFECLQQAFVLALALRRQLVSRRQIVGLVSRNDTVRRVF